ncbi:MAG: ferritin-like domain-containing protein [Verrucomicrobiota bacterium]
MKPKPQTEIVDELNRLMAEEVEAFLRYFQLRYRLRGTDLLIADKFIKAAMEETQEHAAEIAGKIRILGHTPKLDIKLSLGGGPIKLQEALAEALDFERQALDAYREFLPHVAGDPMLEDFIRKQIAVETEHVQEIAMFLE